MAESIIQGEVSVRLRGGRTVLPGSRPRSGVNAAIRQFAPEGSAPPRQRQVGSGDLPGRRAGQTEQVARRPSAPLGADDDGLSEGVCNHLSVLLPDCFAHGMGGADAVFMPDYEGIVCGVRVDYAYHLLSFETLRRRLRERCDPCFG